VDNLYRTSESPWWLSPFSSFLVPYLDCLRTPKQMSFVFFLLSIVICSGILMQNKQVIHYWKQNLSTSSLQICFYQVDNKYSERRDCLIFLYISNQHLS
jgi:hypothetical protein